MSKTNQQNYILTNGFFKSPSISHKSSIVRSPTKITVNSPTNLTLMQQAIMNPVNNNQLHHFKENGLKEYEIIVSFQLLD